ncbi:hypothetical protein SCWH03_04350 [Streptomyces pacificus]|uniref:Uncharacterized protein n=1 Tax=Streptomyces pacificus TaxID=2705029 RepID=A0A6A0AN11_9ACTN|nr:hypothetical protein SCWH03_04350 [Streptomyces pacificus]
MDYCAPCHRPLNGAVTCPECGAYDSAMAATAAIPAADPPMPGTGPGEQATPGGSADSLPSSAATTVELPRFPAPTALPAAAAATLQIPRFPAPTELAGPDRTTGTGNAPAHAAPDPSGTTQDLTPVEPFQAVTPKDASEAVTPGGPVPARTVRVATPAGTAQCARPRRWRSYGVRAAAAAAFAILGGVGTSSLLADGSTGLPQATPSPEPASSGEPRQGAASHGASRSPERAATHPARGTARDRDRGLPTSPRATATPSTPAAAPTRPVPPATTTPPVTRAPEPAPGTTSPPATTEPSARPSTSDRPGPSTTPTPSLSPSPSSSTGASPTDSPTPGVTEPPAARALGAWLPLPAGGRPGSGGGPGLTGGRPDGAWPTGT